MMMMMVRMMIITDGGDDDDRDDEIYPGEDPHINTNHPAFNNRHHPRHRYCHFR